ncbi:MAG: hypothetical protein ACNS62_12335 [Candidatus Cyclobacteriaceae bacterium M3_2C_046]
MAEQTNDPKKVKKVEYDQEGRVITTYEDGTQTVSNDPPSDPIPPPPTSSSLRYNEPPGSINPPPPVALRNFTYASLGAAGVAVTLAALKYLICGGCGRDK